MRAVAVLDGSSREAGRSAQALAGFLNGGLAGDVATESLVFHQGDGDSEHLAGLAPTRDVRLVRTEQWGTAAALAALTRVARDGEADLFLFPPGPWGAELAVRLARRSGGSALTGALDALAGDAGTLVCRRSIYSGHLVGRFALAARPWCVGIDASWLDERVPSGGGERRILSDTGAPVAPPPAPFTGLEFVPASGTTDLEDARVVVGAGHGAGSREGVERIAAAARRMGAAFAVTRPVAMSAWAPMDRLVGVSGVRTAPALCIIAGAYGAPAFYWGIEESRFIVAVNTDEHAPIIANADAALIDDGVTVVEALADVIGPLPSWEHPAEA